MNLNNLGVLMSIIEKLRKRSSLWRKKSVNAIREEWCRRVIQRVYKARSLVRIVVMTEPEVREWAKSKGLDIQVIHKIQ